MGRIVFVTSFKGGVGKTTVSANIAAALTALGKTVLVVDGDYGNRCMDLVLGMENASVFDGADAIGGKVSAKNAIVRHDSNRRLFFLPAPAFFRGSMEAEATCAFFASLKADYDYIIVDSSAEDSGTYRAFARAAEDALVVTFHQSTAIRAAEKTAATLGSLGFANIRMVVNCYKADAAKKGLLPDMVDIINNAKIRLIGAIPYDETVALWQEAGRLSFTDAQRRRLAPFEAASLNIAKRLANGRVPLFKDVYKPKKLKKYV